MKIVVFGASRGVGLEVVKQALEAGHTVTAFVRSPEKFTMKDAQLIVFKGDAMDADAVEKAIAGQEAVISALGPARPPIPHMMEISAKNIVAGMKKHGVRRLV